MTKRGRRGCAQPGFAVPAGNIRRPDLAAVVPTDEVELAVGGANLPLAVAIATSILQLVIALTAHDGWTYRRSGRLFHPLSGETRGYASWPWPPT